MQQSSSETEECKNSEVELTDSDESIRQALARENSLSFVDQDSLMIQYSSESNGLSPSWQLPSGGTEAVAYFFQTVGSNAASKLNFRGYVTGIRDLFQKSSPSSQLGTTTLATAQLLYGITTKSYRLIEQSKNLYGHGLSLTRRALDSRTAIRGDAMLLSVILLGFYEQISENFPSLDNNLHQTAIPAILNHRGFSQLDQPESRFVFFNIQSQMLHVCLARTQSLKALIGKFSHVVDCDESNFGNRLTGICLIIPELKVQATEIVYENEFSTEAIEKAKTVLFCSVEVDGELQDWQTENPWVLRYETVPAERFGWLNPGDYPQGVHLYQDLASASIWNCSRMARIQLNVLMLKILTWLGPSRLQRFDEQRRHLHEVLHTMVQDTCASIPYHTGNRQPFMDAKDIQYLNLSPDSLDEEMWQELYYKAVGTLLAPLMTCLIVDHLPSDQRTWISAQITHVLQVYRNTTEHERPDDAARLEDLSFLAFSRAVDVSVSSPSDHTPTKPQKKNIQYACLDFKCWPKRFTSFSNLARHYSERHRESPQEVHRCPVCRKTFTRPESIPRHMKDGRCEGAMAARAVVALEGTG